METNGWVGFSTFDPNMGWNNTAFFLECKFDETAILRCTLILEIILKTYRFS